MMSSVSCLLWGLKNMSCVDATKLSPMGMVVCVYLHLHQCAWHVHVSVHDVGVCMYACVSANSLSFCGPLGFVASSGLPSLLCCPSFYTSSTAELPGVISFPLCYFPLVVLVLFSQFIWSSPPDFFRAPELCGLSICETGLPAASLCSSL